MLEKKNGFPGGGTPAMYGPWEEVAWVTLNNYIFDWNDLFSIFKVCIKRSFHCQDRKSCKFCSFGW